MDMVEAEAESRFVAGFRHGDVTPGGEGKYLSLQFLVLRTVHGNISLQFLYYFVS